MPVTQRPDTGSVFIYDVTYPGVINSEVAYGTLDAVINTDNILDLQIDLEHDPAANGGLGESLIVVTTSVAFTPTELLAVEQITLLSTLWIVPDRKTVLVGVTGEDTVTFTIYSRQGVTSLDFLLNGVPTTWNVGTLDTPTTEQVQAASGPGVILLVPASGQPVFNPVTITVGTLVTLP